MAKKVIVFECPKCGCNDAFKEEKQTLVSSSDIDTDGNIVFDTPIVRTAEIIFFMCQDCGWVVKDKDNNNHVIEDEDELNEYIKRMGKTLPED